MIDLPLSKIDADDIIWIIGVVYADGLVEPVIKTADDPHCNDMHADLFGIHGTKWRADNTGALYGCHDRILSAEEIEHINNHLIGIIGSEHCEFH